jgi:hypothetical protein
MDSINIHYTYDKFIATTKYKNDKAKITSSRYNVTQLQK